MSERLAKRVLVIGWDAADWHMIDPLMAAGQMANLKRLIDAGVRGSIATLHPVLSPILWNSIATGKLADKHDILGFCEPDGEGGVRPVTSTSRKAKAMWNIASQHGLTSIVVNWFASHPAEHIRGRVVSDRYPKTSPHTGKQFAVDRAMAWPPEVIDDLAQVRVTMNDITLDQARAFVPRIAEIDTTKDLRPGALAHLLGECASTHNAATLLLEQRDWDLAAIYYDTIDHFGHGFMEYHPPRMAHVSEHELELYQHAMRSCYQYHDMMLGRLLELAGPDTTVLLLSDHGFHSGSLRPSVRINPQTGVKEGPGADPVAWHRSHGVLVCSGPGIRKGGEVSGLSLLDVAPTVLALLGLPVGLDMDGAAATQIFDRPVTPETIPTHEAEHEGDGVHRGEFRDDPYAANEVLRQLADLGYVEAPGTDKAVQLETTMLDRRRNLAQVYSTTGRFARAIEILEGLVAQKPGPVHRTRLAMCLMQLNRLDEAERALEGLPRDADTTPMATLLMGELRLRQKRFAEAEALLGSIRRADESLSGLHGALGSVYLSQERWPEAEAAMRRAIEVNPDDPEAHDGLGVALRHQGKAEQAVFHHMKSASLMHRRALTHVHLGIALTMLGKIDWAIRAFEVAAGVAPKWPYPHRCLYQTYKRYRNDRETATRHLTRALNLRAANAHRQAGSASVADSWM